MTLTTSLKALVETAGRTDNRYDIDRHEFHNNCANFIRTHGQELMDMVDDGMRLPELPYGFWYHCITQTVVGWEIEIANPEISCEGSALTPREAALAAIAKIQGEKT